MSSTVTKKELTDHLVETMGLSGKESKALVESLFNTICSLHKMAGTKRR